MATPENLNRLKQLLFLCIAITVSACSEKTTTATTPPHTAQAVIATVVDYSELDGCTYLLELSDGQKLQPVNLSEEFKRKGLKLFITYKYYDGMSTCMAGRMVTVISATIAKDDSRR